MGKVRVDRIGETSVNNRGSKMVIEKYNGAGEVHVRFIESNYLTKASYEQFKKGDVKNPYDRSVFGVGYLGEGKYKTSVNGKLTPQSVAWRGMLDRCYCESTQKRQPAYLGCIVTEEWHNFQNFARWYDENYYTVRKERMELDKDILIKGNKVYSPDTCVYVPKKVNLLFIKSDSSRGGLPLGVTFDKESNDYHASCTDQGKVVQLGNHETPAEAFIAYKRYKELLIQRTAKKYKKLIPERLYEGMMNYEVEIFD